jgi:hypothetical protein
MDGPGGRHVLRRDEVVVAGSALLVLLAAQWILCRIMPGSNYFGQDGKMAQSVLLTALRFGAYLDVTNLNPTQGIGSQLMPKNVWANPAFWPFAFLDTEAATDVSALIALACFASAVYVMMRCFDVPVLPSAVAAQSSIVLFAPTLFVLLMPTNFCATPGDAVVYAPYMVALGLLARLPPDSWRTFGLTAAGITALVLYSIYCDPLWTMAAAISLAVPFAVVAVSPLHPRTVLLRVAALGCCFALLGLTGAAEYLYTLSRYAQRVYFADALDRSHGPELVSAMSYSHTMKTLYLVCAAGWLLGLATLRGRPRVLVLGASAAFAVWTAYAATFLVLDTIWPPPLPIYMEQCLVALYLAGAVAGYWGTLRLAGRLGARAVAAVIERLRGATRRPASTSPPAQPVAAPVAPSTIGWRRVLTVLAVLGTAVVPAAVVVHTLPRAQAALTPVAWPDEPELQQLLGDSIGLGVGRPFRGSINFLSYDADTINTAAALWARGIPTVNEYNQLATPVSLYFVHVLFQRDIRTLPNHFSVSWSNGVYTPAYWGVVQMFGVRYSAERRALSEERAPGMTPFTKPHRPQRSTLKFDTWYIYELPHPNVGDYSPTDVVTARTGAEIMATLGQPGFDFTRRVVLTEPLDRPLVPARDMRLSVTRGGLHVSGRSDGTSLVVLPQQFSHCLRARDPGVRFVRANLMMAGLVFSGAVDSDIVFDYGIFSPACRRADLADLKRLDLRVDRRSPHLAGGRVFPSRAEAVARLRAAVRAIR